MDVQPLTKQCFTCKERKLAGDFPRNKRKRDGLDYQCKACVNERIRVAYAKDPAKKYAKTRKYHLDHPEWSAERLRASHVKHAAVRYQRQKDRLATDPEFVQYRRGHSKRSEHRRRAYKEGTQAVALITAIDLERKLSEYRHACWICGVSFDTELVTWDHVKPLSRGGWHVLGNLRPACHQCNSRKHARWPVTETMLAEIKAMSLASRS